MLGKPRFAPTLMTSANLTALNLSPLDRYLQSLTIDPAQTVIGHQLLSMPAFERLRSVMEATCWDEPETALDLNNIAVMTLLEADQTSDALRGMTLEMAIEALSQGAEMGHPLCMAHLAMVQSLIGNAEAALQIAFQGFVENLQSAYSSQALPIGLVYLPMGKTHGSVARSETLNRILEVEDGYSQALQLFAEVLCQLQLVFYNSSGQRFLQVALQLNPDSVGLNLKQGIAQLLNQQWEGLLHLQRARAIAPDSAPIVHALYLSYRMLQSPIAEDWLRYGQEQAQVHPTDLAWQWTKLESQSSFTYLPLNRSILMAVEPSLRSIVTSVLLAEGDWFEAEMELWRKQLQPGMTVIDVGANVGVYTFSAAERVGKTGQVIAVEPFSGCVRCLEETKRLNQLDWVTICAGAASDQTKTARLSLRSASELNEVISGDSEDLAAGDYEEIVCFPLDSLLEQGITQVDWLKIDAEGHEMQVLLGSERILAEFLPAILYENIAGESSSNTPVAAYLQSKGYQLFRYQPYLESLIPIASVDSLKNSLNIIALPPHRIPKSID